MNMKNFKILLSIALLLCSGVIFAQEPDIYRISKEQKAYEFAVVWKELSYNFANMDNCPNVNLDSLYREYIPIITETPNDFEYFEAMQRFLGNFNNGHVTCHNFPDYIYESMAYPLITTRSESGKFFVDRICKIYSNIQKNDEILSVNNLTPSEYIEKFVMPYAIGSNIAAKKKMAQIGFGCTSALSLDNEKLMLTIKRKNNIEKIEVPFICYADYRNDTIKFRQIVDFYYSDDSKYKNVFITDKKNDFAYIKLVACDENFHNFFVEKYDTIMQFKNLIVDLSNNGGGGNEYTDLAQYCLSDLDSVHNVLWKTRINNAWYKAKATSRIYYYKEDEVSQEDKDKYYPFFYNNAFEYTASSGLYPNSMPDSVRYKGNIFIIISGSTASAAEYFVAMLAQCPKVKIFGEQTVGALGQPLVTVLPSGLRVFINTAKTFDTNGNDISSGIIPDYQYDFSEIYKIENPQKMLSKLIQVIKSFETKK